MDINEKARESFDKAMESFKDKDKNEALFELMKQMYLVGFTKGYKAGKAAEGGEDHGTH